MKIVNSIMVAFAMYSKIPTPTPDWDKERMPYVMCAFPLVGAVIGALIYGFNLLAAELSLGSLFRATVSILIPLFITGGIHMDGFLDTSDALHSYQPMDRKLEILSDSHTGAFAVICGILLMLLNLGLWSELSPAGVRILCFGFVISRCISGWSVAALPCAKSSGLAATFQSAAHKKTVKLVCMLELIVTAGLVCTVSLIGGGLLLLAAAVCTVYYAGMSKKQFGGITGDLAGWFLQTSECVMACFVLIGDIIWF